MTNRIKWTDIQPGDVLTIKKSYRKRPFGIRVRVIDQARSGSNFAVVTGQRLRADGSPSRRRTQVGCREGERQELVWIDDVIDVKRP